MPDIGELLFGATSLVVPSNTDALTLRAAQEMAAFGRAVLVCDGTADEVQLNAVIKANAKVLVGSGQLNTAASVDIDVERVVLMGMGRGLTTIKVANAANLSAILSIGATQSRHRIEVRDLTLDGNASQQTSGNGRGIYSSTQYGLFSDIELLDIYGTGMMLRGTGGLYTLGTTFRNIHIQAPITNTAAGLDIDAGVLDDFFQHILIEGFGWGVYIDNGADLEFEDIYCDLQQAGNKTGVEINAGARLGFRGLNITNSGSAAGNDGNALIVRANTADLTDVVMSSIRLMGASGRTSQLLYLSAGSSRTLTRVSIGDAHLRGPVANQGINMDGAGTFSQVLIHNGELASDATTITGYPRVGATIRDMDGYLAPGESRIASGALTAGLANAYAFNWQNPHATKVLVKRVMVYISTAGGTANSVLDVGVAASTATHDDTLIDGLNINQTGVFDNINDAGANGKSRQLVDENGGTNDWVTGQILVANASSLVGRYEIEYVGI